MMNSELIFKDEVYPIVGAAIEVNRQLGSGFLEAVYQEAMEIELKMRGIPFVAQKPIQIFYKGAPLRKTYVADFVCYDQILIELKVMERVGGIEESQVINYLHATGFRLGLLINFGDPGRLDWDRLIV